MFDLFEYASEIQLNQLLQVQVRTQLDSTSISFIQSETDNAYILRYIE
jgi:hypothetical protein